MRSVLLILGASMLLTLVPPAQSEEPADAPAAAQAQPARPDDNERVCRSERVSGSNIPRRVCRTRKQMREMEEASQRALRDMQDESSRTRSGQQ